MQIVVLVGMLSMEEDDDTWTAEDVTKSIFASKTTRTTMMRMSKRRRRKRRMEIRKNSVDFGVDKNGDDEADDEDEGCAAERRRRDVRRRRARRRHVSTIRREMKPNRSGTCIGTETAEEGVVNWRSPLLKEVMRSARAHRRTIVSPCARNGV